MRTGSTRQETAPPRSGLAILATCCRRAINVAARCVGWTPKPDVFADRDALLSEQRELFMKLGLSRDEGQEVLTGCFGSEYSPRKQSEHPLLMAAVSRKLSCRRILEIGTHDGDNARLLATLFPDAVVTTLDLKDDDPVFLTSYRREDPAFRERFLATRAQNLRSRTNITFLQMNSLELLRVQETFDFIWVDGAHGYPIVAIDIANAVRLLSDDGVMACDDVWVGRSAADSDPLLKSCASYDTLSALSAAGMVDFHLILKRLTFKQVTRPALKHIAIVRRASAV